MAMNYGSKPVMSSVMPPSGQRNRGRNLTINLSIEDVTLLKDRYGPNNDTADPTCAIMRAYFNELNRDPNLDTPIYPCEGFPPGVTEQYVTVNYRISGQSNKTRIFRFFLDASGQCRCEIVSRIPGDFEDRGSGPTGTGTGMGNLGTLGNVTFGVTQPSRRRNRGRNLTIDLSIEDVTLLKDRYGPNNDTVDPTCAIMRAYFSELNRNPNLDTPIYPCEGFPPGVTEQYVTVNYRLTGGRNRTRIFRFFLDASGQCRCEIVSRIPGDFEDTGAGPTGPETGMGDLNNSTNNVTQYLESLLQTESKPSNLVTNTMESFSASTINSQNIMDSSLGLVSILETANTPIISTNRTVFISPNVNIPGAPTQLEKNKIQTRIQDSISSRPFTQTFNTQTQQFRIDVQRPIITNTNTFSNISVMSQVNLSKITNTYPVNTFSTVTGNFGFTPTQQREISFASNRFGTIGTPSSAPGTSNTYSKLPTNKFHNS